MYEPQNAQHSKCTGALMREASSCEKSLEGICNVGILVVKGLVLLGVQDFQQRRGGIATNIRTRLVYLVE